MKATQQIAVAYFRMSVQLLAGISPRLAAKRALKIFCTPFGRSKIKTSPLFDKAEKLSLTINDKKLVGYRWNAPQQKRFLILHGFQSSAKNFEQYISPMIEKGYEVLAFDAPAHGESEGKQINVLQYREMIREIYNQYGTIDSLLAHSFGGLAICLALECIPHDSKTGLVLIAPATETSTAIKQLYKILELDAKTRKEFEQLIFNIGGYPVEWYSIVRALKNLYARILWIHDENDDVTPVSDIQPVINAGYPNIRFILTQELGHRRIYRDTNVLKAVFDFFSPE